MRWSIGVRSSRWPRILRQVLLDLAQDAFDGRKTFLDLPQIALHRGEVLPERWLPTAEQSSATISPADVAGGSDEDDESEDAERPDHCVGHAVTPFWVDATTTVLPPTPAIGPLRAPSTESVRYETARVRSSSLPCHRC